MTESQEKLLQDWLLRLRVIYRSYYASAVRTDKYSFGLGVAGILLTAILASKFIYSSGIDSTPEGKVILGKLGIVALCISTIQLFLKLPERAEKFRSAGVSFSILHREIEQLLTSHQKTGSEIEASTLAIQKQWGELSKNCPTALTSIWDKEVAKHLPNDISVPQIRSS